MVFLWEIPIRVNLFRAYQGSFWYNIFMATQSSESLLRTLVKLFPYGTTTTLDMATRLSVEGVGDIALTEMRILSAKDDPQDFVIAYLDATHVTSDLEVREGYRRDYEIAYCLNLLADDLRFLDLGRYGEAQLKPGKISPLDLARLPVGQFKSATFLISERVQFLANEGVDMILPRGSTSFEILPTRTVIDQIKDQLSDRWKIVLAFGGPYYGLSPHI